MSSSGTAPHAAFGNGHFGITGGPVMGKVIAEIVAGAKPSIDTAAFSPARFTRQ
jgi:D-amino-acid dehydrogenase